MALSENCAKHEFETRLDELIRRGLDLVPSDVAELRYGNPRATAVLLLMNVETVRRLTSSSERFSFRESATKKWSLEHIHARNAEQLNRADQWSEWLRLHRDALPGLTHVDEQDRQALVTKIDAALEDISSAAFASLEQEMTALFSLLGTDGTDIDTIDNLALLASDDNSALGNSVFEVKRRYVLARDQRGSYIPVASPFMPRDVGPHEAEHNGWKQRGQPSTDDRATAEALAARLRPALERVRRSGDVTPDPTRAAVLLLGVAKNRLEVVAFEQGARVTTPPGAVVAVYVGATACVVGDVRPNRSAVEVLGRAAEFGCREPLSH